MSELYEESTETYREWLTEYMSPVECPACQGKRLRPASLAVRVKNFSIAEFTALPMARALMTVRNWEFSEREMQIAGRVLDEIRRRLEFLSAVGLDYLSLERSAATLSGGEAQRIRLATQIGSKLRGVLYVLDEPSIGLHPRDNGRLLDTLDASARHGQHGAGGGARRRDHRARRLRDRPGARRGPPGRRAGGRGRLRPRSPRNAGSLTGRYLSGALEIAVPPERRQPGEKKLVIRGARQHNLKNIDVEFPLGLLTVVTGVSGSGKSTLVNEILYRALAREIYGSHEEPGAHDSIEGIENIDKVIRIDQAPIGRTPRSNPATYTGLFTPIRDLYAMLPESRERGYKPGRFSFNVKGGRCEACQGDGLKRIEMNFLPDVYVTCDVCRGRRYNRETLQVKFKGHSIADLLDATVEEALPLMENLPQIRAKLQTLYDVGLGYVHLGQSSTTLSGGEAQRIKLAKELSKRQTGRTFYLLDEPTTGPAFRRRAQAAGRAAAPGGIGQHGGGDRAQPGRDQDRRLDHRPGPGWRRIRRPRGGRGHARAGEPVEEKLHRRGACARCSATGRRHEQILQAPARFRGPEDRRSEGARRQGARLRISRRVYRTGSGVAGWLDSLPRILAGNSFRAVVDALAAARARQRAIIWGLGGHVIKCGLAPVLIDLMRRGYATAFAMNGAAAIHDFEIALAGHTSEDVEAVLPDGRFGAAEETGREMNRAIAEGDREGLGMGEALGALRWMQRPRRQLAPATPACCSRPTASALP